ncbi:hypothetical protein CAT59_07495 [Acinetobacter pittii]|jgi:hypothetical protein|uniref:Uncharacterized protein n=1 Tax=Acinetobacter pittii TaxID=48296 RepID=A0A242U5R8_ACIPI|nr:hypothetical protein [Acinetobacter pittii]OTU28395.1 hypothetical protein CAT59_07495 [Acinetobacter pittii]
MKIFALIFSILWIISVSVILYFKVTLWGLDANNLSLILSAIYALISSVMYFYPSNEATIKQTATADNKSKVTQVGRDYTGK